MNPKYMNKPDKRIQSLSLLQIKISEWIGKALGKYGGARDEEALRMARVALAVWENDFKNGYPHPPEEVAPGEGLYLLRKYHGMVVAYYTTGTGDFPPHISALSSEVLEFLQRVEDSDGHAAIAWNPVVGLSNHTDKLAAQGQDFANKVLSEDEDIRECSAKLNYEQMDSININIAAAFIAGAEFQRDQ